jgi:uncharacterized protein YhhL (DUF1145 family)
MPNAAVMLALKILVMGTWFVAAAGFLFPDTTTFGRLGRGLFVLLSVVHIIECAVFYGTLKKTGRPLGLEILNTLVFGVIHFAEAKAIVDAREGES